MKRSGLAARSVCLGLAIAAVPGAAQAATVEVVHLFNKADYWGARLDYRASPGERNEVVISRDGASALVTDTVPLAPGENCRPESTTAVRCSLELPP